MSKTTTTKIGYRQIRTLGNKSLIPKGENGQVLSFRRKIWFFFFCHQSKGSRWFFVCLSVNCKDSSMELTLPLAWHYMMPGDSRLFHHPADYQRGSLSVGRTQQFILDSTLLIWSFPNLSTDMSQLTNSLC